MTLVSNVTAPFRASALPSRFTPVVIEIDVSAKMFPLKIEFVPRVAELPTCQKMLQADAPLVNETTELATVVSAPFIIKTYVPLPESLIPPVPMEAAPVMQYTPGVSGWDKRLRSVAELKL